MNFNAPLPRAKQPGFHEGSALRSVRDSDVNAKMWQKNRDIGKCLNSVAQATEQNSKQIAKLLRRVVGGGGGNRISLQVILYGDPTTQGYEEGIFYKILDSDDIVTTGIVCAGSATPVKATAGKYLCLKSVPKIILTGHTGYNAGVTDSPYFIPQIPDASGSLDPADANKYWELFTPSQICDGMI